MSHRNEDGGAPCPNGGHVAGAFAPLWPDLQHFRIEESVADANTQRSLAGRTTLDRPTTVATVDLLGPLNEFESKTAPSELHLRGDVSLLQHGPQIAVVGSRRASEGLELARRITRMLVEQGVTVISGLALGIDTVAHKTAITGGGPRVGALGTPLDRYAVPRNRRLQDEIGKHHLLVWQFPSGQPTNRSHFTVSGCGVQDQLFLVLTAHDGRHRHHGVTAQPQGAVKRPVPAP